MSTIVTGGGRMGVVGIWRIVEMDLWDIDAIDLMESAFVAFEGEGEGGLQFVAVRGQLDWRTSAQGHIYFHLGDDSGFRAVRESSAAT